MPAMRKSLKAVFFRNRPIFCKELFMAPNLEN